MKHLGILIGTTKAGCTKYIQEIEDRISDTEEKIKDMVTLAKGSIKSKNSDTTHQKIWDTMKRTSQRIIRI